MPIDARNAGATSVGAASLSWSHTIGASANCLVVESDQAQSPRPSVTGIDWDFGGTPQALTVKGTANESAGFGKVELWYLLAPVPGTKTIKVTYSGSCECGTGSSSWTDVDQATPFNAASPQTATGTGTTQPSLAVTSAVGEQVIDGVVVIVGSTGYSLTVGASQTEISNHNRGANTSTGASSDEPGAASVTMSWSGVLSGDPWAQVGVSLRFSAAPTPFPRGPASILQRRG